MCDHTSTDVDPAAQSRQNLIGLSVHVAAFVFANAVLFATDLLGTPEHLWFFWPLMGWGVGVTAHTVGVLRFETLSEDEQRRRLQGPERRRDRRSTRASGDAVVRRHRPARARQRTR